MRWLSTGAGGPSVLRFFWFVFQLEARHFVCTMLSKSPHILPVA